MNGVNRIAMVCLSTVVTFAFQVTTLDFWGLLDKYGFPTAALVVVCLYLRTVQRKAEADKTQGDAERNGLIRELIDEVKKGNSCLYKQ